MEGRKRKASAAARWARCLCGLGWLGWVVLAGACRDSVGTAVYATIDFPPSLTMDQLRVSGMVAGSGIGPHFLPEKPERLLANGDTFRVLLPSAPDKSEAELTVEGLREGTRVAMGSTKVQVLEGMEVDVTVRLEPAAPDDGEFCPDCPSGCCVSGVCTTPTFNTCGTGGIACRTCDPRTADTCASEGYCACGRGAACDPRTTDRCAGGACRCGSNAPCGFGQECVSGRCACTTNSCAGCCVSGVCAPGNTRDRCGKGGGTCMKCSNACSATGTCS